MVNCYKNYSKNWSSVRFFQTHLLLRILNHANFNWSCGSPAERFADAKKLINANSFDKLKRDLKLIDENCNLEVCAEKCIDCTVVKDTKNISYSVLIVLWWTTRRTYRIAYWLFCCERKKGVCLVLFCWPNSLQSPHQDPDDISYLYSGYAPLSVRLVEQAETGEEGLLG